MTEITIVRNDVNFVLEFTIKDADDEIVDLTDVSAILLKYKKYDSDTVGTITGTVTDADEGECQFDVSTKFQGSTEGEYKAEIQITYNSGKVITATDITIKVISDL